MKDFAVWIDRIENADSHCKVLHGPGESLRSGAMTMPHLQRDSIMGDFVLEADPLDGCESESLTPFLLGHCNKLRFILRLSQ